MQEYWPQNATVKLRKQLKRFMDIAPKLKELLENRDAQAAETGEQYIAILDMQEERREELEIVNAALLAEIKGHTELHRQRNGESGGA